jgi:branched-chain amino acid transport system substrate-binding protein
MHITRRTVLGSLVATVPALSPALAQDSSLIRLGLITPLSGSQQEIGSYVRLGAEIAVAQINASGGVGGRKFELIERDDRGSVSTAVAAMRELAGQGVNLHLGAINSSIGLALGPVMEELQAVHVTCAVASDKINHQNYSPNVFRVGQEPYMFVRAETKLIAEQFPHVRRWVGLIPDHEYGRTVWATFVDGMMSYFQSTTGQAPQILDPIMTPFGAADFKPQINAALRLQPEGIVNANYGADLATILQQAKPYGLFQKTKLFVDTAGDLVVAETLKKQVVPYWASSHWYAGAHTDNPISVNLYKEAVARSNGRLPMGWVGEGHSGVLAYAKAISIAHSTATPDVIAALKGLHWDTCTGGRILRAEDNQAVKDVDLLYVVPDEGESGYRVADTKVIPGALVIEPPTPGQALSYRTA